MKLTKNDITILKLMACEIVSFLGSLTTIILLARFDTFSWDDARAALSLIVIVIGWRVAYNILLGWWHKPMRTECWKNKAVWYGFLLTINILFLLLAGDRIKEFSVVHTGYFLTCVLLLSAGSFGLWGKSSSLTACAQFLLG